MWDKREYVEATKGAVASQDWHVMTAHKRSFDCANGRNNSGLRRKSRDGYRGVMCLKL